MQSAWVETVAKRLGPPILTTTDEVRFNCWRSDCGHEKDTHWHLYVNPTKGRYFCQRCQRGGTLDHLAKVLGLPQPERSLTMWDQIIRGFLFDTSSTPKVDEEVGLPDDYERIFSGTQAYRYLLSRGISEKRIDWYRLGFGTKEQKNRIIIPDYDQADNVVYWVARSYSEKHYAKYKNAKAPREKQVFNLGRLLSTRAKIARIVICEGPISAIVAGYDAVATYGKYVTGAQVSRLVRAKADEYVIAFDGDAVYEAVSLATRLQRLGLNLSFVKFPYSEDPASRGPVEVRKRIRSAVPWTEWTALEMMVA